MSKPVSVEIYTVSHRILGRITPDTAGLFSYLNIPTTSYVDVEGAHLSRLHQPGRMVSRYPVMYLVKDEIIAVLTSSRGELGTTGVARGGYSTTVPHWVHIILGGYELRGQVETPGKFNFGAFMFEGERSFIPLYNAEMNAILFRDINATSPAMLFSRKVVDAVALLPKDEIPSPQTGTSTPPLSSTQ
jgi:hypothetical protein